MLALEKHFKQTSKSTDWLPRLDGAWQLVFSAPNKTVPAWSYVPVNEDAMFDAGARTISLASDLGPFHFDFTGDFAWDAQTQVMEFGFTRLLLDAFGRRLLERPISIKRKTYSYFLLEEGADAIIACARSSAGSLTLMKRRR
ncbi:hypothetical protein WJX81_006801 [Elliptochloris bilobata]|uniref:Plastid lipid-associated protein/fibrillin conserved domain-containing protein n=1 Tax=Elliptochloris bilobata TaxID=381761 RepID=A0AAW1QW36_9CHLO